jgi:hypothetical protein
MSSSVPVEPNTVFESLPEKETPIGSVVAAIISEEPLQIIRAEQGPAGQSDLYLKVKAKTKGVHVRIGCLDEGGFIVRCERLTGSRYRAQEASDIPTIIERHAKKW